MPSSNLRDYPSAGCWELTARVGDHEAHSFAGSKPKLRQLSTDVDALELMRVKDPTR